jgi:hypothetical protein
MHRSLRLFFVLALLLPMGMIEASAAGAASGTTCKSFSGNANVSPGLPKYGSKTMVRPTISIKRAKLSGCGGSVKGATASATLKFVKSANCASLITQTIANVSAKATGTLTITWNNKMTSKVALSLSFGSIPDNPTLAKLTGTVTSGRFQGMKSSGTVEWSLSTEECFGGAPLTSFTFSEFAPLVTK